MTFGTFDFVSSPVLLETVRNNGRRPEDEPDGVNLLLALTPVDFLAGLSGIRVGQSIIQQRHH